MTSGVIPSTLGIVRRVAHVNAKEYAPKPRGPRAWVSSRVEIRLKAAWEAFSISVPMAAPSRPARTTARSRRGGERGWDRVGSALTVVSALTVNAPSLAREKSHNRNAGQPGGSGSSLAASALSGWDDRGRGALRLTMHRPDFFIVGAPKAGTSAMAAQLGQHPEIFMCPVKEPQFFGRDQRHIGGPRRSLSEYLSLFDAAGQSARVGEASTNYLYSATAPEE